MDYLVNALCDLDGEDVIIASTLCIVASVILWVL